MAVFGGVLPSIGSQMPMKYRVNAYKYGNGYEAVGPDGANGVLINWQFNWDNLDSARSALVEAWLNSVPPWVTWAGDGTILPSSKTFRVTTDGWQKTALQGQVNSYTVSVEQVY
jgi:phage-related protein